MTHKFFITALFPLLFGVMALFFLVIGLRGIILKKPFVISSRWLLILVLLGFTPAVVMSIPFHGLGGGGGPVAVIRWLSPAMIIIVAIFLYFALRGYTAFGITDVSFREALVASLKELNLPYEETLASIRLPTAGADLQVSIQSWMGIGQLKMKQREFNSLLSDVVGGMNDYYRSGAVAKVNLTCCIFYTAIGGLLLVFAGVFLLGLGRLI